MGLSSLLLQFEKRGKLPEKSVQTNNPLTLNVQSNNALTKSGTATSTTNTKNTGAKIASTERYVDPAIARLKELRRLEREKLEKLKPTTLRKISTRPVNTAQQQQQQQLQRNQGRESQQKTSTQRSKTNSSTVKNAPKKVSSYESTPVAKQQPTRPKMSYSELMKKAATIDQSKFSVKYPGKDALTKSTTNSASSPSASASASASRTSTPIPPSKNGLKHEKERRFNSAGSAGKRPSTDTYKDSQKAQAKQQTRPKNIHYQETIKDSALLNSRDLHKRMALAKAAPRQANAKIQEMLEKKRKMRQEHMKNRNVEYEESDDELSDFLVSDDEFEEEDGEGSNGGGYNREEIWAMFNKGKKRQYVYDDDSDDMEATGAEVLEEERRSKINAEREDRLEQERLERLAALKRKRLKH
ncbi:hypothetical protein LELG_02976 [Lodderomyces elongisporus NRRL YB-4239]|uniref:SPT2 chromatin protein n=1 Tax=Lodderomyces elongisporus (strain ATCC 11503 / CBS 2605 / JCM 1781 / NBRC 1676 / NRRL YB-4239) TaxID=379508 RepID=A5E039_LODEL|nr:hypothetical protein LELG_02976 [Lodderomyces elongisporus NRRL YB-4239]